MYQHPPRPRKAQPSRTARAAPPAASIQVRQQAPSSKGQELSVLHAERLGISSFDGFPDRLAHIQVLCLQDNNLQNFYGIPTLPNLKFLHVDSNRITSFLGMSHQPKLEILTMENNPICSLPDFRLFACLACGTNLHIVNYRVISEAERKEVADLGGSSGWAARCIAYGYTGSIRQAGEDGLHTELHYLELFELLRAEYVTKTVETIDPEKTFGRICAQMIDFMPPGSESEISRGGDTSHVPDVTVSPIHHPQQRYPSKGASAESSAPRQAARSRPHFPDRSVRPTGPRRSSPEALFHSPKRPHHTDQRSHSPPSSRVGAALREVLSDPTPVASAVSTARRYAQRFAQHGTIHSGADDETTTAARPAEPPVAVASVVPMEEEVVPPVRGGSPPSAQSKTDAAVALHLLQGELGALSIVELESIDCRVVQGDFAAERSLLNCRVQLQAVTSLLTVSTRPEGVTVVKINLQQTRHLSLDEENACVLLQAVNLVGPANEESTVTLSTSPDVPGETIQQRAEIARGLFKWILLFKCTPSDLDLFYRGEGLKNVSGS